jgi:hypothetical protein
MPLVTKGRALNLAECQRATVRAYEALRRARGKRLSKRTGDGSKPALAAGVWNLAIPACPPSLDVVYNLRGQQVESMRLGGHCCRMGQSGFAKLMHGQRAMNKGPKEQETVIPLNPRQKPKGEANKDRFSRQARELAILANLPEMEYERERGAAAKRLECRANIFDKLVHEIRSKVTKLISENSCRMGWKERPDFVGMRVNWHISGRDIDVFVASAISDNDGNIHVVVVLADGNGTAWDGTISRE